LIYRKCGVWWVTARGQVTMRGHSGGELLGRYAKRNENFVLVTDMSGGLEAYRQHELIQVINDALIETVEL
jgi:hypothetical protein